MFLIFLLSSCSEPKKEINGIPSKIELQENSRKAAVQLCDCLLDAGVSADEPTEIGEIMSATTAGKVKDCFLKLNEDFVQTLDSNKEKIEFVKGLFHAIIESPCLENTFDMLSSPFLDFFIDNI